MQLIKATFVFLLIPSLVLLNSILFVAALHLIGTQAADAQMAEKEAFMAQQTRDFEALALIQEMEKKDNGI